RDPTALRHRYAEAGGRHRGADRRSRAWLRPDGVERDLREGRYLHIGSDPTPAGQPPAAGDLSSSRTPISKSHPPPLAARRPWVPTVPRCPATTRTARYRSGDRWL